MTPDVGMSRTELFAELDAALHVAKEKEEAENEARKNNSAARDRLANAQKNIDKYMQGLRDTAPWDTPWRERARHPADEAGE